MEDPLRRQRALPLVQVRCGGQAGVVRRQRELRALVLWRWNLGGCVLRVRRRRGAGSAQVLVLTAALAARLRPRPGEEWTEKQIAGSYEKLE